MVHFLQTWSKLLETFFWGKRRGGVLPTNWLIRSSKKLCSWNTWVAVIQAGLQPEIHRGFNSCWNYITPLPYNKAILPGQTIFPQLSSISKARSKANFRRAASHWKLEIWLKTTINTMHQILLNYSIVWDAGLCDRFIISLIPLWLYASKLIDIMKTNIEIATWYNNWQDPSKNYILRMFDHSFKPKTKFS